MMANAHWQLHQAVCPERALDEIYWHGTSTANQRIESWWRQMSKSQTLVWKVSSKYYFTDFKTCENSNMS
jgi:hypothetical protein